jgi:hypothetical protein
MAAYSEYDAATLTALIGEKLKEVSAMQAALVKLLKKSGGSVSGSSEKKKRAARGPIAWTEWTREVKTLYPKYWTKWSEAKSGTVVQFAAAMREKKPEEYATFETEFKAKQAAAAALAADSSDSEEDEAPKAKKATSKKPVLVESSDSSSSESEEEKPASVVHKKRSLKTTKPAAGGAGASASASAPAHATAWTFGGQSYYKTAANQVWSVDLDDEGERVLGDWAGLYMPSEDRIDDSAAEPNTKPRVL